MRFNIFISVINQALTRNAQFCIIENTVCNKKLSELFSTHGFFASYQLIDGSTKIRVFFKHYENSNILYRLVQISKPGRRIYSKSDQLRTKYHHHWYVLSSTKGFFLLQIQSL